MSDDEPISEETADEAPPPAKRKKRKKKATAETGASAKKEAPKPLPGAGTPQGEMLREAMRAFEIGDYARLRARCDALADADDPEVRAAAAALKARTNVDPMQVVVVLVCAAILAVLVAVWVL